MRTRTTIKLTAVGTMLAGFTCGCSADSASHPVNASAGTGGITTLGSGNASTSRGIAPGSSSANSGSGGSGAIRGTIAGGMETQGSVTGDLHLAGHAEGGDPAGGKASTTGESGPAARGGVAGTLTIAVVKGGMSAGGSATGISTRSSSRAGSVAGGTATGSPKSGSSGAGTSSGGSTMVNSTGGSSRAGTSTGGSATAGTTAIPSDEGFYKVIFMDVGVGLDDFDRLPAADKLGYAWEFVSGEDEALQHFYMTSNANDDNGVLLYPDREPRFMMIYTGGGYGDHIGAVGAQGTQNVKDFFNNGGSYTGTCHGNYLAWNWGYNFWPGKMNVDNFEGKVNGTIPENSPILQYYSFGGDHLIEGLDHYKGGYATGTLPEKTEVLLLGKSAATVIDGDGHPTGWAYKPKDTSGRLCGLADHPEYAFQSGEIMDYLAAAFHYAHDGVAPPDVKASLVNGEARVMDKSSGDQNPAYTKIGDKQYHHFTVSLPNGAKEMTVILDAAEGFDLNLYLAKDTFAFASRAQYVDTSKGPDKTLTISALESGTWYVGVECATTVSATKKKTGYEYSGKLEVLNGVGYSIKATWTE